MSKKEIATTADAATLAAYAAQFPQEAGFTRLMLPRITFKSQDVMDGKGKNKTVSIEAGTFFTEHPTEEKDEAGKAKWEKKEIGLEMEGFIIHPRRQLRYYDEPTETYYSTPIFDELTDVIPLFAAGKKIATGTPAELKKSFEYINPDGKTVSKLEDNVVLYISYEDELFQMNLRGSSMYSYKDFARKTKPSASAYLVHLTSEGQEKGSIEWNQMKFSVLRPLTVEEMTANQVHIDAIRNAIDAERAFYAQQAQDDSVTAAVVASLPAGTDKDDF